MKHILIILFIIFSSVVIFSQSNWDFSIDSLFLIQKTQNFSSKNSFNASMKLRSTDSSIIVQVSIENNLLQMNEILESSERIELWFADPNFYNGPLLDYNFADEVTHVTSYICGDTSFLYLYKQTDDLNKFQKEIMNPEIKVLSPVEDTTLYYSTIDDNNENLKYVKEDIDSYLKEARSSMLKIVRTYFALVHFGIFPYNDSAIMYDKDSYSVLEKQANIKLPDYSKYINSKTISNELGYITTITIPVEALGFINLIGNTEIEFLINIIKADKNGNTCFFSTSPNPNPDQPETFSKISLRYNVNTSELKIFKHITNQLYQALQPDFIYTTMGWKQVDNEYSFFNYWEGPGGDAFRLPNIQKFRFLPGKFEYRKDKLGSYALGNLEIPRGNFLIINDKEVYPKDDVILTFLLPDSSLGLITSECNVTGRFNQYHETHVFFINKSNKLELAEYEADDMDDIDTFYVKFSNKIKINSKECDSEKIYQGFHAQECVSWNNLIKWDVIGKSILVDFGNNQIVRIAWDINGKNVTWTKL